MEFDATAAGSPRPGSLAALESLRLPVVVNPMPLSAPCAAALKGAERESSVPLR
jgi:hypothetical protein